MFSIVSGAVLQVSRDRVVVDVNGLGLEVQVTEPFASGVAAGDQVTLHTVLHKRQDAMTLSGFTSRDELELFTLLTETPSIGAKIARSALGMLGSDGLVDAIRRGNEPALRRIPGVGPRAAAILLVALRPKFGSDETLSASGGESPSPDQRTAVAASHGEALAALQALGWKKRDVVDAVDAASSTLPPTASVEILIRAALANLGRRK